MEEGELGPTNGVDAGAGGDELYNALHQRLVASGEWQRLLILLKRMLDECGWEAQFQSTATTKAKQQPVLDVPSLIDALTPHAKGRFYTTPSTEEELLLTPLLCTVRHAATTRQGASARKAARLFGPKPRRCLVVHSMHTRIQLDLLQVRSAKHSTVQISVSYARAPPTQNTKVSTQSDQGKQRGQTHVGVHLLHHRVAVFPVTRQVGWSSHKARSQGVSQTTRRHGWLATLQLTSARACGMPLHSGEREGQRRVQCQGGG